ncbi:hypothetical protein ACXIZN_36415 [Amycolatopsis sp. TRM77291]
MMRQWGVVLLAIFVLAISDSPTPPGGSCWRTRLPVDGVAFVAVQVLQHPYFRRVGRWRRLAAS